MPKRMETAKEAISKLDKAIKYKTEALDSSIESMFLEMVSIREKLDEDKVRLADALEKFYGLTELSGSIKEMYERKISYENMKTLDGSKARVPEVKIDGVPDDFDGDTICVYDLSKESKPETKTELERRVDNLETQIGNIGKMVEECCGSINNLNGRLECVEHDLINHLEKETKKHRFFKPREAPTPMTNIVTNTTMNVNNIDAADYD